ncbi:Sushi, von Willebrand factor type A, EGF and pentraxin domain-containing protein 1, partial [Geodia barretti]
MRECHSNGEWSGFAPFCVGNVCPLLVAPDNGQVFVRGVTVGSTARYSCQQGFVLRGAADRTCLSQGTWSGREPVCQAVNCPDLPDPANGEVTLSGITFDSTATYRCVVGFGLVGVSVRYCQADSTWSGQAPTCQISMCSNLEPPQNGNIVTTSTQFGGKATYSCTEGYQLEGDEVRTCQANGFWSGSAPFCSIVNCGFLDPPKDGRVSFTSTSFGAVAAYVCFPGYRLEGVEERTCQADGQWSDQEPSCRRIDCGLLEIPKNGDISFSQGTFFRSVATYNCDAPFQLVGSVTRVCQSNMEWSGEAPVCESIECEDLQSPENGLVIVPSRLPGSTATYSCNTSFNLIGSQTRSCLNNGFWSGVVPICQAADCGPLKPPRNGDVEVTGTTIGSIASYECFEGYYLEGDEIRTCVDGGIWTGNDPTCSPIDCGILEDIFNGFVEFDSTLFGSIASYTCRDGFVLMGKGIRQCIESGQWSGDEPVCQEVNCGQLGRPENGQILISGTSFGFTATYNCNDGYIIARGSQ